MKLPDLTAIVRFKTYDPLITTFKYKDYPDKAVGFVMRKDLLLKLRYRSHPLLEQVKACHQLCPEKELFIWTTGNANRK